MCKHCLERAPRCSRNALRAARRVVLASAVAPAEASRHILDGVARNSSSQTIARSTNSDQRRAAQSIYSSELEPLSPRCFDLIIRFRACFDAERLPEPDRCHLVAGVNEGIPTTGAESSRVRDVHDVCEKSSCTAWRAKFRRRQVVCTHQYIGILSYVHAFRNFLFPTLDVTAGL